MKLTVAGLLTWAKRIKRGPDTYSVVIADYRMGDVNGSTLVPDLLKINKDLLILVYSGDESRDTLSTSFRSGAARFVSKSESLSTLLSELKKLCDRYEARTQTIEDELVDNEFNIIGRSKAVAAIRKSIRLLSDKNGPVLIIGETGTGKELVAKALHGTRTGKFIARSCAGFSVNPSVASSELFGHIRGAFTGADRDKKGVFEEAQGGTVFLDEIHGLSEELQIALLRALQEKVITRVGSNSPIPIDCRIIAASKPSITGNASTILRDLFYRISENIITVPTLRERKEDLRPLIVHFTNHWCAENKVSKKFLESTFRFFESWNWPGNIRELQNEVNGSLNTCLQDVVGPEFLSARLRGALEEKLIIDSANFEEFKKGINRFWVEYLKKQAGECETIAELGRRLDLSKTGTVYLLNRHGLNVTELLKAKVKAKA
ncbi:MAG: sigma-54-dependent Fis family transcriptional regulator [Deltaproteobacteria bacterium]|nr:sigma-54-dependent Fis family transcriptional regulator [Deltaproteobacteria bacterium]